MDDDLAERKRSISRREREIERYSNKAADLRQAATDDWTYLKKREADVWRPLSTHQREDILDHIDRFHREATACDNRVEELRQSIAFDIDADPRLGLTASQINEVEAHLARLAAKRDAQRERLKQALEKGKEQDHERDERDDDLENER